ncbi:MAG: HEAT repeat domain-containing protein [Myxococcales bacterium]|nr:MAG: HEAT repeat domain-containing protein [Myxococcales bacterium]
MTDALGSRKLATADSAAIEQVRALGREGEQAVPRLLEFLSTPSWVVRREAVAQLGKLGRAAAVALCAALEQDRKSERRLAAVVDALVASDADIDDLVLALTGSPSVAVVCDALQVVGRRRITAGVQRVVELTSHSDDNVAVASIEALGQLGGEQALACLLGVVVSPSFFRSFPAIDVLSRLGDTRAVEPLVGLLQDPLRGAEAARALGRLGDETATVPLAELLTSNQAATGRVAAVALAEIHDRSLRRYGTEAAFERALAPHAHTEALETRLERALVGADDSERRAIGVLLGFFTSSASLDSLRPLLDEEPAVAEAAAASLARLARLGQTQVFELLGSAGSEQRARLIPKLAGSSAAVPALVQCLADPDSHVRVLACDALAKTGEPSCADALFVLLGDADIAVSQAATGALQALGTKRVEDLALEGAVSALKGRRQAALRILGHLGSQRGLPVLLEAAQQEDERGREIALLGLATIGGEEATRALLLASVHESPRTRAAAVRGLGHLEPSAQASQRLRERTTDADAWVRYYACQALGNAGDASASDTLLTLAEDPAGQVRVAAVDALAKLRTPEALEALGRAALHSDLELRRAALAGIGVTKTPAFLPILLSASRAADTATRLVAVSGLASFGDAQALERVCEVAHTDAEPSVKNAAIELLGESASPQATVALIALLGSESCRARAVQALSRHTEARAPHLAAALEDASPDVAEALVTVLTSLPASAAEPLLLAALQLPNEPARRAAVRSLRFALDSERTAQALARAASKDPDPEVRRIAAARSS